MPKKDYKSHIDKPHVHTTSNGSSYVTSFDVLRSVGGRELIRKHAEMARSLGLVQPTDSPNGSGKVSNKPAGKK